MDYIFQQTTIRDLIKYNKALLLITVLLAASNVITIIAVISKEERWLLIPAIEPDKRMIISSHNYHETYLKEWATFVAKGMFTTSPNEVERQIADMRVIASSTTELDEFFAKHLEFVKGSNVSSVFFPKQVKLVQNGVLISGTLRYWFANGKDIAVDKQYLLTYKRGANHLLLLSGIKDQNTETGV